MIFSFVFKRKFRRWGMIIARRTLATNKGQGELVKSQARHLIKKRKLNHCFTFRAVEQFGLSFSVEQSDNEKCALLFANRIVVFQRRLIQNLQSYRQTLNVQPSC